MGQFVSLGDARKKVTLPSENPDRADRAKKGYSRFGSDADGSNPLFSWPLSAEDPT